MSRINYITGDATDPQGPGVKIIVHCVSNNGRSYGKGFALALAKKYPGAKAEYKMMFETVRMLRKMPLGFVIWWQSPYRHDLVRLSEETGGPSPVLLEKLNASFKNRVIVAAIVAQDGLGKTSLRPLALLEGLGAVASHAIGLNASLHMPRIGCGLAGGNWAEVEPLILGVFNLPLASFVPVTVYDLPK